MSSTATLSPPSSRLQEALPQRFDKAGPRQVAEAGSTRVPAVAMVFDAHLLRDAAVERFSRIV